MVHEKTPIRLLGIPDNMWLEAKPQRHKVIDSVIEVAAYLFKIDNLRIDQRLKVISMCLPSLFCFSAPLIDWPLSNLKLLTAVWIRAYKNAWNLGKGTANCLFTFPRDKGGLQVKLPLGTLFTSVWGNLERCNQLDDDTRQMLALCYRRHPANASLVLPGSPAGEQMPRPLRASGCLTALELEGSKR